MLRLAAIVGLAALSLVTGDLSADFRSFQRAEKSAVDLDAYKQLKSFWIEAELEAGLAGKATLTEAERNLDKKIKKLSDIEKNTEGRKFPASEDFFKSKEEIDNSELLHVMRQMPKGGILHFHLDSAGDYWWIVKELSYQDTFWVYTGESKGFDLPFGAMQFSKEKPGDYWMTANELRVISTSVEDFDQWLYDNMELKPLLDIEHLYNSREAWTEFNVLFPRVDPVLQFYDVYRGWLISSFKKMLDINTVYCELKDDLRPLYDLDGNLYNAEEKVKLFEKTVEEFKKDNPRFQGAKLVLFAVKALPHEQVAQIAYDAYELRKKYPNTVAAFDLVGEEDFLNPIEMYADILLELKANATRDGIEFPFVLHAGETNDAENTQLFDAILLGSKRIGHGYALLQHPTLMELVKDHDICIEVCPISNQVLGMLADLQNHPGRGLIKAGVAVTISPDDPAMYGYGPDVSYDWYEAVSAWGLDLREIKTLARNSIQYSMLDGHDKVDALAAWEKEWNQFVESQQ